MRFTENSHCSSGCHLSQWSNEHSLWGFEQLYMLTLRTLKCDHRKMAMRNDRENEQNQTLPTFDISRIDERGDKMNS